jgi:hypothetical protein
LPAVFVLAVAAGEGRTTTLVEFAIFQVGSCSSPHYRLLSAAAFVNVAESKHLFFFGFSFGTGLMLMFVVTWLLKDWDFGWKV